MKELWAGFLANCFLLLIIIGGLSLVLFLATLFVWSLVE